MVSKGERAEQEDVAGYTEQGSDAAKASSFGLSVTHPGLVPDITAGEVSSPQTAANSGIPHRPISSVQEVGALPVALGARHKSPASALTDTADLTIDVSNTAEIDAAKEGTAGGITDSKISGKEPSSSRPLRRFFPRLRREELASEAPDIDLYDLEGFTTEGKFVDEHNFLPLADVIPPNYSKWIKAIMLSSPNGKLLEKDIDVPNASAHDTDELVLVPFGGAQESDKGHEEQKFNIPTAEQVAEVLSKPVETQEDIDTLLNMLSTISPDYCAPLIAEVRAHNVPIEIGKRSATYRTVDQFVNSKTTYASKITIGKGKGFLDVMHEIRHAGLLDPDSPDYQIDPRSQKRPEIEDRLKKMAYRYEAQAVGAEIELVKVLEDLGIDGSFFEAVWPGMRDVYEQGGVTALAEQFPQLAPQYISRYDRQAKLFAVALTDRKSKDKDVLWTDAGCELATSVEGFSFQVDPEKLLAKFSGISSEELVNQIRTTAFGLLERFSILRTGSHMGEASADRNIELPDLHLEPRVEPEDKKREDIISNADATQLRVAIAGKYADFLKKVKDAQQVAKPVLFDVLINLAEHSYGQQSADLYQQAYEIAKTFETDDEVTVLTFHSNTGSRFMSDLGFSLLRAGYTSQGEEIMTYFVDKYVGVMPNGEISQLTTQLVELGKEAIASRMLGKIGKDMKRFATSFPWTLIDNYASSNYGEFTDRGRQQISDFFTTAGHMVTASEFHDLVLQLHQSGDYHTIYSDFRLNSPPLELEKSHYESYVSYAQTASEFSKCAAILEETDTTTAEQYHSLARDMYRFATFGAQQLLRIRMEELEDAEKGIGYDPEKGINDLFRQKEAQSEEKRTNYRRDIFKEVKSVLAVVFQDDQLFSEGLELLYALDATGEKMGLFAFAAKHMPSDLPIDIYEKFMQEWQDALVTTCEDLSKDTYIETPESSGEQERMRKRDTHRHPPDMTATHLYNEQRLRMAESYLARDEEVYQAKGLQILTSLPESQSVFFNPYKNVSYTTNLFDKDSVYTHNTIYEFEQIPFKVQALLLGAELAPAHADLLRDQASRLAQNISFDIQNEQFYQIEHKAFVLMKLVESLALTGDIDKALSFYNKIGVVLHATEQSTQKRFAGYEALTSSERGYAGEENWNSGTYYNKAKFWQQDYASRLRAYLIVGLEKAGRHEESLQMARELVESFGREVSGRRERFDVRSMTATAAVIANEGMQAQSTELFTEVIAKLGLLRTEGFSTHGSFLYSEVIDKLGLLRGNENLFDNAVSYFSKSVRDSDLPDDEKDRILSKLIITIAPERNADWTQMLKSFGSFARAVEDISEENRFPQTEIEALKVSFRLVEDAQLDRRNYEANYVCLSAMKRLFTNIVKHHPEIVYGSNYEMLSSISHDSDHLLHFSALLPSEAQTQYSGDIMTEGIFDLTRLRAKFYDKDTTYSLAKAELERVLARPELTDERLEHLMQVYKILISQEVSSKRDSLGSTLRPLEIQEVMDLQGVKDLYSLIADKIYDPEAQFSPSETKILFALLHSDTKDEGQGKELFYQELIGNESVPILVQQVAFENFLQSGRVSKYVQSHFEDHVIGADAVEQKRFYSLVKRFSRKSEVRLETDHIMAYLFENPQRTDEFFTKYRYASYQTLTEIRKTYNAGDTQERAQEKDTWLPDVMNDLDILFVFNHLNSRYQHFDGFVNQIRHMYGDGMFDSNRPKGYQFIYSIDQLQSEIQKYQPSFNFTKQQKRQIEELFRKSKNEYEGTEQEKTEVSAIPDTHGKMNYADLESIVGNLDL